jgi:hypothetical protein
MNEKIELAASALRQIVCLIDDGLPPHIVRSAAVKALAKLAEDHCPSGTTASSPIVEVSARSQ